MFQSLTILGSTGSIGRQTLDVVARFRDRFQVVALSAGRNLELLSEQVMQHAPAFVHVGDASRRHEAERLFAGYRGTVLYGDAGLEEIARVAPADLVVVATVGYTGLAPTIAALEADRHIALANKEVLVCGGDLVMALARARKRLVLPVDSEHNAIFQCLQCGPVSALRKIILTCSGGSFRNAPMEAIERATAAETLRHPTWTMGSKITVDSATLMNKGFEVIEAHHLFGLPLEKIEVIVHPQSIIHSMVEFIDGSMIAQLGRTDMRLPIQNILTYPERAETDLAPVSLAQLGRLEFEEPDADRFPCLAMAYEACRRGGTAPCVLNAANEVAVAAHLAGDITAGAIPRLIRQVLNHSAVSDVTGLETLRHADAAARKLARRMLPTPSATAAN